MKNLSKKLKNYSVSRVIAPTFPKTKYQTIKSFLIITIFGVLNRHLEYQKQILKPVRSSTMHMMRYKLMSYCVLMALMIGKFIEIKTGLSLQRARDILWSIHEVH